MSDSIGKLQQALQAAQREVSEARAHCERHDAEHKAAAKELEDNRSALLFMLEDLERSRRSIEQSHREWMAALDVISDPIFIHDREFRILRCNRSYQQYAGVPFKGLIGRIYYEVFPKTGAPLPGCLRAMKKAEEEEEVVVGKTIYRSRAFSIRDEEGAYLYSVHTLEDITESRRAQTVLNESKEKFRKISESAQDAIITANDAGNIVDWNAAAERMFGRSRDEVIGQSLTLLMPERFQHPHCEGLARVAAGGAPHVIGKAVELAGLRKDGSEFPLELSLAHWQVANTLFFTGIMRDITERKQSETTLRERKTLIETLLENAPIGFAMNTMDDGRMGFVSRRFAELYDVAPGSLESVADFFEKVYRDPVFREQIRARVVADISSGDATRMHWEDVPLITADGGTRYISASNIPLPEQNLMISTVWDVTDRYKAELTIQHVNRALTALSTVNRSLVRATDENELLDVICRAIVEHKGYRMVWVGYRQHDENKSIRVMASAGHDEGYLEAMQLTWAENEQGMGTSGRAIRSGETQVCRDLANDPAYRPWREAALKRGYRQHCAAAGR